MALWKKLRFMRKERIKNGNIENNKQKGPILRKHSRPVEEITPRIIRLLDDMKDTLHKAGGGGACRCAGSGC